MSDFIGVYNRKQSNYRPIELTAEVVEDMASMYYTLDQIAERFNMHPMTLMANFGEAFHRGAKNGSQTPRRLLAKLLRDFEADPDVNLARADSNGALLLKAIETYTKSYGKRDIPPEYAPEAAPVNPLAALSELELRQQLEKLGYVKKED